VAGQRRETLISSKLEKPRVWTRKEETNNFDPTDHKGRGLDDVKTGDPPHESREQPRRKGKSQISLSVGICTSNPLLFLFLFAFIYFISLQFYDYLILINLDLMCHLIK
jgi:hypothetical protein